MGSTIEDLTYAARKLRQNPGFTFVVAATLALGIGANTAIFTLVEAVLLRPLPFTAPEQLVKVFVDNPEAAVTDAPASPLDIEDWHRRSHDFASLAAYSTTPSGLTLTGLGEPEKLATAYVSGDFFATLKAPEVLGRTLLASDAPSGSNRVVVLSHGLWQRRFGADPAVVGRTLILDDTPLTVVGVLGRGADFPNPDVEIWAPASLIGEKRIPHLRQMRWMAALGRLRPGVSLERATAELSGIARGLAQEYPESNKG